MNKHRDAIPAGAVYIGRGSPWGNPFRMWDHETRDEVCERYIAEHEHDEEFKASVKRELRGRDLVCFCAPSRCHGDWLLKIANEP